MAVGWYQMEAPKYIFIYYSLNLLNALFTVSVYLSFIAFYSQMLFLYNNMELHKKFLLLWIKMKEDYFHQEQRNICYTLHVKVVYLQSSWKWCVCKFSNASQWAWSCTAGMCILSFLKITHLGLQYSWDVCKVRFSASFGNTHWIETVLWTVNFLSCKYSLWWNMCTNITKKQYSLEFCGSAFSDKSYLVSHMHTHTEEKPYTCEFCGCAFVEKATLVRHVRTHTREKPYSCEDRVSTCSQKWELNRQMERTHVFVTFVDPYF